MNRIEQSPVLESQRRSRPREAPSASLLFLFLFLCLALPFSQSVLGQISSQERQALVALYNATDGDNWFNAEDPGQPTGWLGPQGTECTWTGVLCDPDDTTVEGLFLSEFDLFGTLPPEIGDLSGLIELYLDTNFLQGPIPPELGNLSNLEALDLYDNFFEGAIPQQLGQLSELFELFLDFNFLTGTIPSSLTTLDNLEVLVLAENFLTGPLPSGITQLSNLVVLDVYDNGLSGPIPGGLGGLSGLIVLDLGYNEFSGTIPASLGQLTQLEALFLDSNQLTGQVPGSLTALELEEGDLRWNALDASNAVQNFFDDLVDGDFAATQTRAPTGLAARAVDQSTVLLTWTPIDYTLNDGGYIVERSTSPSGPVSLAAIVDGKTSNRALITNLPSGSSTFAVRAFTDPHDANPGTVTSATSAAVTASTASTTAPGSISFTSAVLRAAEGETRRLRLQRTGGSSGAAAVLVQSIASSLPPGLPPFQQAVQWQSGQAGEKFVEVPIPLFSGGNVSLELELSNVSGASLGSITRTRIDIRQKDLTSNGQATLASAGDQPKLARSSSGRKISVWSAPDGDGRGVFAQSYDASGRPQGEAVRLNSQTAGSQSQPSVAVDDQGGFVAVWRNQSAGNSDSNVVGRFFNPSGNPSGQEFVASQSASQNGRPDVALKPNGEAFVVWQRVTDEDEPATLRTGPFARQHGALAGNSDVVGRFFSPNGQPMTTEKMLSDGSSSGSPSASASDDGSVVVAFEKQTNGGDSSVAVTDVQPSGNPSGLMTISQAGTTAAQPQVEHTKNGDTVVVYQQQQAPGGGDTKSSKRASNIVGRLFNPDMQPMGGTFSVSGAGEEVKKAPEVSTNSKGDCFVVWQTEGGNGSQIEGQALDGCSQSSGSKMTLNNKNQRSPGNPATALDDDGSITAVFTEDDLDEGSRAITGVRMGAGGGSPTDPCAEDTETLCLSNGRFKVRATWRDFQGGSGTAKVEKLTNDTGYFWFFDPANVEILLKTLDACSFANRFWVFAGGLTSVEVVLTVTDTATGNEKTYTNPLRTPFQPVQDTDAFNTCSNSRAGSSAPSSDSAGYSERAKAQARVHWANLFDAVAATQREIAERGSVTCTPDGQTLCLNQGRFEVKALWGDFSGGSGAGQAVALTPDTGYFWFFASDNVEVGIKVLDACGFSDAYWVFAAGLTDVDTELMVTDTQTGAVKLYRNDLGVPFAPIQDTAAFETCP